MSGIVLHLRASAPIRRFNSKGQQSYSIFPILTISTSVPLLSVETYPARSLASSEPSSRDVPIMNIARQLLFISASVMMGLTFPRD